MRRPSVPFKQNNRGYGNPKRARPPRVRVRPQAEIATFALFRWSHPIADVRGLSRPVDGHCRFQSETVISRNRKTPLARGSCISQIGQELPLPNERADPASRGPRIEHRPYAGLPTPAGVLLTRIHRGVHAFDQCVALLSLALRRRTAVHHLAVHLFLHLIVVCCALVIVAATAGGEIDPH